MLGFDLRGIFGNCVFGGWGAYPISSCSMCVYLVGELIFRRLVVYDGKLGFALSVRGFYFFGSQSIVITYGSM